MNDKMKYENFKNDCSLQMNTITTRWAAAILQMHSQEADLFMKEN